MREPVPFADVLPMTDADTMTSMPTTPSAISTPTAPSYLPASGMLRAAGAGVSVVGVLAAVLAASFAARTKPEALWAVAGLQGLVMLGGCFGLVWSRGRFAQGPVLGLLCAAGAVLVGGMLSFVAHRGALGPLDMKWWSMGEVFLAIALAVIALVSAIERDRGSRIPSAKGVLLCLPALFVLACVVLGSRLGFMTSLAAWPTWARMGVWLGAGFVASVMLCMAAHHFATAFGLAAKSGRADSK